MYLMLLVLRLVAIKYSIKLKTEVIQRSITHIDIESPYSITFTLFVHTANITGIIL